jgi:hypothetical protein
MGPARRVHACGRARRAARPRDARGGLCLSDRDASGRRPGRRPDHERALQQLSAHRRADVHLRRQCDECERCDRTAVALRRRHGRPSAGRPRASQCRYQSDLFRHERQRGRGCIRSGPRAGAHDVERGPLSAGLCCGNVSSFGDARPTDADLDPDDLLRADRQCFGRRHVHGRSSSRRHHGARNDDRHRRRRAAARFSACRRA